MNTTSRSEWVEVLSLIGILAVLSAAGQVHVGLAWAAGAVMAVAASVWLIGRAAQCKAPPPASP